MSKNLKEILSPRDRFTIDATAGTSWVPKDPIEVLLPYIEEGPKEEETSLDTRRQKAKEVYDGYGKIIEKSKELRDEIADRCKNVTITLEPSKHKSIIDAVKRVFGTDGRKITFQMYQRAIDALADISNENIPKPGAK